MLGAPLACRLLAVIGLTLLPAIAQGLDFTVEDPPGNGTIIAARGTIEPSDAKRLQGLMRSLPADSRVTTLMISSPGGNLYESSLLAEIVRGAWLRTVVPERATCASACFLVFAAGTGRLVSETARIGVHSASMNGVETAASVAFTTLFARYAASFGVPPGIVGKLVLTRPDGMTWLTPADLRSMQVEVFADGGRAGQPRQVAGEFMLGTPAPPAVAASRPVVAMAATAAFQAGRLARSDWEVWLSSLYGGFRAGAVWWADVRTRADQERLTCTNQRFIADAIEGCLQSRGRLTSSDLRRRREADF